MVYVRRISPEDGVERIFKGLTGRVQSLETNAAGSIVIRETLVTADPETGVETIIGQLPDGSYGLQEFVNDTTPPGQPSTPKVQPAMGGLDVWWDGLEDGGIAQPKDYSHTDIEYSISGTEKWGLGGTLRDANGLVIGNLEVGTEYSVRLISYDKNKNASNPSNIVLGIPVSFVDNPDVNNALQELRNADRENAAAVVKAQESATGAHTAATSAGEAALKAAGIANGKGRVIYAPTAPTSVEDRSTNNLWIDTSGAVPKNTPHRWDEKEVKWAPITDKAALDAGIKAGNAEQVANAASATAAAAATAAGKAQTSANEKNRVWYLPTAPAGNDHREGDTWFDTANGNRINRWTGAGWVSAQDASIAIADKKASDAATAATAAGTTATNAATAAENAAKAAGAKGKVIIQSAAPDAADRLPQNLWIDTTGGTNTPKRWVSGTTWSAVTDKVAQDAANAAATAQSRADAAFLAAGSAAESAGLAQQSADGKNKVWYSSTKPAGTLHRLNDLWFDEANGNRPMRWNGADWVSTQDQVFKAIEQNVEKVTQSTNGKNSIYYAATAPTNTTAKPLVIGDTWFDTANGNRVKVWSGGKWNDAVDKAITDAAAAASEARAVADGKNTTYYQGTAPVATTTKALVKGDTWFDTANGYALWTHSGSAWVKAQDTATTKREALAEAATDATNKANAAKSAAITAATTAAAADAKSQAEAAESRAAVTAAADAKNKADAAQAAALSAAKTYADAQATGAGSAALEAAKTDATNKADAAKQAAIVAAALDATAKKEQAEANAALDAKTKADKALADAKLDATAKADAAKNAALLVANAKNKSSTGATAPTTPVVGDIWVDTANGNVIKIYTASGWTSYQDKAIKEAKDAATGAQDSANGKNTNTYDLAAPTTAQGVGRTVGDTWFRIDSNGAVYAQWTWGGAKWDPVALRHEVIASLDAGKISTGTMDAKYITANTITTEQMLVGFGTNMIPNPGFETGDSPHLAAAGATLSWYSGAPNSGTKCAISQNSSIVAGTYTNIFQVSSATKAASTGAFRTFDIKADTDYVVSFYAKFSGTSVTGQRVRPAVYFYGVDGAYVGSRAGDKALGLTWNWAKCEYILERSAIPTGSLSVGIILQTDQNGAVQHDDWFFGEKINGSLLVKGSITADLGILGEAVVGTAQIAELGVTTGKIANLAVNDAKIANIHAGKITAGEINAARIGAKTISVDKLLVSSTDNLVQDADFSDPKGLAWAGAYSNSTINWDATGGRNGAPAVKYTVTGAQQGRYGVSDLPATGGSSYRILAWVKSSATIPAKGVAIYYRQKHLAATTYHSPNISNDAPLAANVWHPITGVVKLKDDATSVNFGAFIQQVTTTGTIWVDYLSATRAADGELVVDGSIKSTSITADGLDAGVIKFGSMDGGLIKADSITSAKLAITDMTNFAPNLAGSGEAEWTLSGGMGVVPFESSTDGKRFNASNPSTAIAYGPYKEVTPGDKLYASASSYRSGVSNHYLRYYWYDKNKSYISFDTAPEVAGSSTTFTLTTTVPATAAYARIASVVTGAGSGGMFDVRGYKQVSSTLIEKGAITTDHMTAGTIDGKIIKANTIKGTQIEAKSISTDSLLITSTDNLIQEADFGARGIGWDDLTTTAILPTGGRNGGPALRFTATPGTQLVYNKYTAAVEPGNVYRLNADIKPSFAIAKGATSFTLMIVASTGSGAKTYHKVYARAAIAANTWGKLSGLVTIPETAATMRFALELPGTVTSGTIDVDFVSVTRATDGELIVNGSITSDSIIAGGLDAAVIKTGTLDAARIGAQTITAEKMVIGQGANLISDPMFLSSASNSIRASRSTGSWTFGVDASTGVTSAKTTTATTNNAFMFALTVMNAANAANMIPTQPGSRYLFDASVYTNISAGVRWNIYHAKADGTVEYKALSPTDTATGRRRIQYEYVVPAGVVAFMPALACLTTGAIWVVDGGASVALKVEGNLIVDGALTGKKITGALIETLAASNRGIKLNDVGLIAYSNSGVETLRFDGENSMITGATVRTAASGPRAILDAEGVRAIGMGTYSEPGAGGVAGAPYETKVSLTNREHILSTDDSDRWPGIYFESAFTGSVGTAPRYPTSITADGGTADGLSFMTKRVVASDEHSLTRLTPTYALLAANDKLDSAPSLTGRRRYSEILLSANAFEVASRSDTKHTYVRGGGGGDLTLRAQNDIKLEGRTIEMTGGVSVNGVAVGLVQHVEFTAMGNIASSANQVRVSTTFVLDSALSENYVPWAHLNPGPGRIRLNAGVYAISFRADGGGPMGPNPELAIKNETTGAEYIAVGLVSGRWNGVVGDPAIYLKDAQSLTFWVKQDSGVTRSFNHRVRIEKMK